MTIHEIETQVTGVVLAGGKSRRFGRDKALASFEQTTLIGHAVALLRAVSPQVLVVTHPERDYLGLDATIIHDVYPDQGPLGGIFTACRYVKTPFMLVLSCDMPLLSPRAIFHLLHSSDSKASICVYRHEGRLQPFPGLYAVKLEAELKNYLKRKRFSMHGFLSKTTGIKAITPQGEESEFTNVNTQHQLMSLQRRNRRNHKDNDHETNTPYPPGSL